MSSLSEAATDVQTTPSTRLQPGTCINEVTKNRVRSVDPCGGHCLVENVHPDCAVQFAHCIPRRLMKNEDLLTKLEWYWGMERYTLNLDTRYNIFTCGATLHAMHDKPAWMLVPEEHVVQQLYDTLCVTGTKKIAHRESFPTLNENIFKYRLLPIPGRMEHMPIVRQHTVLADEIAPSFDDFMLHICPYSNLPLLTSHLHPKFVIFEAGRKISLLLFEASRRLELFDQILPFTQGESILPKIAAIYAAWTGPIPDDAMDDEKFDPPHGGGDDDSDNDDHDETRTAKRPRRSSPNRGSPAPRKSQRLQGSGDNTAPAEKAQHSGHKRPSHSRLSGRTLYEHGQVVGRQKWTVESIRSWSEQCDPPLYA